MWATLRKDSNDGKTAMRWTPEQRKIMERDMKRARWMWEKMNERATNRTMSRNSVVALCDRWHEKEK